MKGKRQLSISINLDKDGDVSDILDELDRQNTKVNGLVRDLLRDYKSNGYLLKYQLEAIEEIKDNAKSLDENPDFD